MQTIHKYFFFIISYMSTQKSYCIQIQVFSFLIFVDINGDKYKCVSGRVQSSLL
jgi:hypothetical protein